jgi:ABC-type sugar transport system permease subunit/ABC-type glycerol-3-phosphate transport system substrate-binding protein
VQKLSGRTGLGKVLVAGVLTAAASAGQERVLHVMAEDALLGDSWRMLHGLAADFEARHGDVRVELMSLGGAAGTQDRVKFLLAGDVPLDLTRIDVTELAAFVGEGALLDLQPRFDRDAQWRPEDWWPVCLDALRDSNGHLYGLPQTFTPYVMYVNETLLAREGIARPADDWTWADLEDISRRVTRDLDGDGRVDQFGISLTQWLQAVAPWIWQAGGELMSADGSRSRLNEPPVVEALEFLQRLLHVEHVASDDATFANQLGQGLFQSGRTAFYGPVGYWERFRLRAVDGFEWDVLPLPRLERPATAVAMSVYVVPRTARHPDLAYAFLREVLGSFEYQRQMGAIGNGLPGLVEAARSEAVLNPDLPPRSVQTFFDVLEHARFLPPLANWRKIESLCQAELEGVLLSGNVTPADAARRMASKADAYLERERERRTRTRLPRFVVEGALALSLLLLVGGFLLRRGPPPGRVGRGQERAAAGMLSLWATGFVLFLFGPAVVSGVLSLCEWSPLRPIGDMAWVGLDNYGRLLGDGTFRTSLGATTLYAALSVPLSLGLALLLAMLLRAESNFVRGVRTAVYLPAVLSPVIVAAVWRYLLDDGEGLINRTLATLGLGAPRWLKDPQLVVPAFVLMSLWAVGTQMLVFLAALKALDPALEEAARMDGAGPLRRLVYVVLPQLTPVILFNGLTGLIAAFQVFAQPYVMTQGGPGDSSRFLVLYLYETGFRHLDMGYASAIAWVLFGLLAGLALVLLRSSRRWVFYSFRGERP